MHLLTGRWQLSATRLALLLALFFTLLNYGFFRTIWQAWRSAGGDGTFLWSVPLFIFLCLNIIFHLLLLPYLHKLIIPLILLLSAAVSYSVIFLGVYFDRAMLTNVLITTPAESAKLLTVPYALWLLALGVVPALLYLRVRVVYRRWWRELALRLGAGAAFARAGAPAQPPLLSRVRRLRAQQPRHPAPHRADQLHRRQHQQNQAPAPRQPSL